MSKIIGIDLGTSNSAAAVMEGNTPVIIPSAEGTTVGGGKAFPSYVAFTKDDELLVGEPARRQAIANPEATTTAFKRKMGTSEKTILKGKEYSPQQLSGFVLQKIKRDAEAYLGARVERAVITVPAYFSDSERQATKDAGSIAGLEVVRIINEPTAAALAYGLDKGAKEQKILVFDLGGGTLDVTIMEFGQGVFEVISTSGDTKLGGTDMDRLLVEDIITDFKSTTGMDLSKDPIAVQRIREAAEKAKIELSSVLETEVNLPFITADSKGPKHLQKKITRATLEALIGPIIERCRHPLSQALEDAKITPAQIQNIILVGGPTRMPSIQKFLVQFMGEGKIARGVDPMEAVARGAAIQGAVLAGDVKDVLLLDVTPLTLGIETLGGVSTPLIERNTTIPSSKSQIFSTAADNQPSVEVHVLQGERAVASDNRTLGRFMLDGIPPSPRGIPQIEVTFDIDANGILTVTAKDKATGKSQNIVIKDSTALSKEEIDRMRKEAELHAQDDRHKKELIEVRNQADTLMYTAEKTLREFDKKISDDDKKSIHDKLDALKGVKDGNDESEIRRVLQELSDVLQKVGAGLYKSSDQSEKTSSDQTNADKVVEGEVVDPQDKADQSSK